MKPQQPQTRGARPRSLYRAVLSLAVAAVIAASIPFAAIYAGAVNRAPAITALAPGATAGGHVRLVTTASGRQIAVPSSGSASAAGAALVTRTSSGGSD